MTDDLEPMAVGPGPEPLADGVVDAPIDAPIEAESGAAEPTTTVEPTTAVEPTAPADPPSDGGDRELLALIDRLAALLDRSDLTELEVEAGGTGLVLRKPSALAPITVASVAASSPAASVAPAPAATAANDGETATQTRPSVKAPLTGIFYASPAPGSAPYVSVGGEVAVGQIIGLIEAMKLFNEIKSDLAGRVVRVVPESGTLVKAKQPLIEVEPL
jgi:acetyl-CoA carboxylase biotin carboxyl carrier protein